MYQSWEERTEEHLTLKQEEGEHLTVLICCPTAPLPHTAAPLTHFLTLQPSCPTPLQHCPTAALPHYPKQCLQGVNCIWPQDTEKVGSLLLPTSPL